MPSQLAIGLWMILATLLIVAVFNLKVFSFIDKLDKREKNSLDGIRAFLSIFVIFHHFIFSYFLFKKGDWVIEGYPINEALGPLGVSIFFMISGFLFAGINKNNLQWWYSFYIKRLFRIGPMCCLSSIICIIIAFSFGDLKYSLAETFYKILFWFDMGIINKRPDVSTLKDMFAINAGVTWTLRWEWIFYASLPIISLLFNEKSKKKASLVGVLLSLLLIIIVNIIKFKSVTIMQLPVFVFCFSIGFVAKFYGKTVKVNRVFRDFIATACLVFILVSGANAFGPFVILPALIFLSVCNGFDFFGALNNKGVIRLGEISYSLYLMHGTMWYLMYHFIGARIFDISSTNLMLVASLTFLSIFIVSSITFSLVEIRLNGLGKKLASKITQK